jgi:AcrR family transcriptional regulator
MPPTDSVPKRGRPRSEKARTAILEGAAELLMQLGLDAVSVDAIAERAGVSKATIYRWWPSKELLALDVMLAWTPARAVSRDTGSLRGDLLALLRPWVREMRVRPIGRIVAAFVRECHTDPRFAEAYRARIVEPRRDAGRAAFERAMSRREVPGDVDVEVALDLMYGPIYHRLLHGHAQLTDRFVVTLVDLGLRGILVAR